MSRIAASARRAPPGRGRAVPDPMLVGRARPDESMTDEWDRSRLLGVVATYLALTKPRIILLLLVTTVPAMILAERAPPSPALVALTLLGGALSAGGANAINQFVDRDIDEVMRRTRRRPLPTGRIRPGHALVFGLVLGALGFSVLALTVNMLSAALATGALVFYVFVYTMWLKRRSPQNIVIGGAAGAVPVLVGWAAVTGKVAAPAVAMFAVVFLWTPPHFWALALLYERDYASAGVPMLPVVAGRDVTARLIVRYAILVAVASLILAWVGRLGPLYVGVAALLGAWFVAAALRVRADDTASTARALFKRSIVYLTLLFAAIALDPLLRVRLP